VSAMGDERLLPRPHGAVEFKTARVTLSGMSI
jgi:hypothetical protein